MRQERLREDAAVVVEQMLADATFEGGRYMVELPYRHRMRLARVIVTELCAEGLLPEEPP